ncbi:MAG: transglycosylase SLT domain-containing protein [Steroidobacteraceae bacterium]
MFRPAHQLARAALRRHGIALCLVLLAAAGSPAAEIDPLAAPRAEFQQAWEQVASPPAAATRDSASLRGYVLYPWLQAARLNQALRTAGTNTPETLDQQIAAFLRAQEGAPAAQELRRSWLASLAARAKWQDYLAFHRDAADGAALRCHAFTARIELQRQTGLETAIAQAWLTPRSLPECERAFEWLRAAGGLGDELVEQRVRLALEAGNAAFARQIAARLPAERAAPLLQWAALLENPQRGIDALIAAPDTPVQTAALLAGWTRLARSDRAAAKQRFEKLRNARKLDRRAASPFALALALPLAWDRDADALAYFDRVDPADFDGSAHEWQIRAALWAGQWRQAARGIAALTEETRRTARWRYWAARVAAHEADEAAARPLYESLLTEDNYYSAMAAARLQRMLAPNPQALAVNTDQLSTLGSLPAFVRAHELLLCGLTDPARAEWRFGQDSLPPAARTQAIHLAARWGWYAQAVATATGERVFNDYALLYPRPYDAEVATAAQLSQLPTPLIYGVIRQESLYQRDALSSAGARGLMQLLPETARRTARQWKQPAPAVTSLFDPAVNVVLGAAHLKDLLGRFDGQWPLALAAYNAGPGAAQRWRPDRAMDTDIWIENIPYNETRNYVQRILWHTLVFSWLGNGAPQDTRGWLGTVGPQDKRE